MKIYFAGSISGGRENQETHALVINELKKYGEVLTEHIADKNLTDQGEKNHTEKYIFERDTAWIRECDVLVAEITTPSLGVGYEIGYAESLKKPILCLYRQTEGKRLSGMIIGNSVIETHIFRDSVEIFDILHEYFTKLVLPKI
jgi:nucleoside 2-deoxyribosyltransferase